MFRFKPYILLVFAIWWSTLIYGQNHINFRNISPILNNKNIPVYKTVQDKLGNIWMLSSSGILLFDGYDHKLIEKKIIFPKWHSNDAIKGLVKDGNDDIWLTSDFGLISKYHSDTGLFEDFGPSLNNATINTICVKGKNLWLASKTGIIFRYTKSKTDSITTVYNKNLPIKDIKNIEIIEPNDFFISTENGKVFNYSIDTKELNELVGPFTDYPEKLILVSDQNYRLWIGTETQGLFVYDLAQKKFIQNTFFKEEKFNVHKEMFLSLLCDKDGYIWGGTDGGGMYKINSNTGDIDLFTKQKFNSFSLGNNTILDINEDNHKNIWICAKYGNLYVLPSVNSNISYHSGSANKTPERILSIHKSSKEALWLGTDGSGLTKVAFNSNGSTDETQYFNDKVLNTGFYVQSITEDSRFNIWLGTYKNGLWFHNTLNDTFEKINITNLKRQEATDVRTVFKDSKGRIWVGSNISINVYNANLKLLASFENNTNGLKGSNTESIIEDKNGTIWLGIYGGGFFKFNENHNVLQNSSFSNHTYTNPNNKHDIPSIKSMAIDDSGNIWQINNQNRLLKFNTEKETHNTFEDIESLNELSLKSVLIEGNDNIWMGTNSGICHLDIKNNNLQMYYWSDGVQGNIFMPRSAFNDKKGTLYFGGVNGLNYFNPKTINKKISSPKLYITTIEILNQPIDSLFPSQTNLSVFNLNTLKVKYNQSSFSFKFSAVDNVLNPKYYYAYRLKGFDEDWISSRSERLATYTNIPSGNYTFEVKAGTNKGVWDIPKKQIAITIEPPFWKKPLAYLIYFLCLGLIIVAIRRWYSLRKNLLLEKVINKKENELHDLKMNFFTKMSHEIQTPITLILGPIDDMLKRAEQNGNLLLKQRLKIISNNAKRLSKIARELTLVRNKELNKLKLIVTKNNLFTHIEEVTLSFKELARMKQIDFAINCPKNLTEVWYDKEKVEHIMYNLLFNAFKFTPREGNIQLNVIPIDGKKQIKLSVSDTGPGIPKEELNHIFELFYQSKSGKKINGSGIGLALTKELLDLHKGEIKVESTPIAGTVFTFTLPITEDVYEESERITTSIYDDTDLNEESEHLIKNMTKDDNLTKKTILIVEDNYDLQEFLKDLLCKHYNVILAENGEEGYHYAKNNFPDLILSDIMMPKLDGIEMCQMLQHNPLTKHIPVILLTAKNSTNSKIAGLKSGAIEYINKPFNTKELLLKIQNIISAKEHIISKYRKEVISRPEINIQKSQDEIFLENMTSIINSRLDEANFKIEELADSLNMSYSSLYRKCQNLTGHSLVDYIRIIRLKKAAILITKYGYNISEVAYMVGFNDPKYFSKCFKKQYGKNPKDFWNEAKKNGVDEHFKKYNLEGII